MLRHLGETTIANRLESAVRASLANPKERTSDLGGTASTSQFTDAIIEKMAG